MILFGKATLIRVAYLKIQLLCSDSCNIILAAPGE